MGIFKVGVGAFKSVLSDQWREYFYCPSMPSDVLATKGVKRKTKLSFNKGSDNLITNGSVIAVNEGQCMMIVDQGAIVEVCAEAGEFVYDASSEPSIFTGNLSDEIVKSFEQFMKRVSMGGDTGKDQRIYYIFDPILFYKNICGNFEGDFRREKIDPQLKSEMMTALQPAFAMMAFAGMNMAANAGGINASQLFQMANQQQMYQQPRLDGYVLVEHKIKENSAWNVERKNQQKRCFINVTSADGSRKIRRIHPNYALSAEIRLLMRMQKHNN